MRVDRLTLAVFGVSLLTLSPLAFYSKSPLVFYRFDGTYLLILVTMQNIWTGGGSDFVSNPLQGIGGLELPWHVLLDPGLWLIAHLSPLWGPTAAMTLYAVALAIAICWLGIRLGLDTLPAVGAAWVGLLLALPYVYPTFGFEFLWGVPNFSLLILLETAAILLFLDIGRGPRAADAARFIGIAGACGYQLYQIPHFVPVSFITVAFFSVVALIAAKTPRERMVKVGCAVVLGCLALPVFGGLEFGLYGFAKPTFFWYEFYERTGTLFDLSFFIAEHSRWPAWIVYGGALAGALHAVFYGRPVIRPMARGFLGFVLANLAIVLLVNERWRGPRIAYIDIFAYPFYCVFAAHAAATAIGWLKLRTGIFRLHSRAGMVALCALPWLVLIDYWPPPLERPLARNLNPFIWPPSETPVTKFLADEIALQPGAPFRGRVASVAGSDFDPQWVSAPFITQHSYDGLNLFFSGNDHRMYGLWYYGIPTLFESNQFSSPFFHLVNARLLNAPGARDVRSYETQSIVNDRIMALLGVSYLMSDKVLPERVPVVHQRLFEAHDLYVYSVPAANVAGYAVTQTRHAGNAQDAITLLADPSFDPLRVAVLTTEEEMPALVPTSRSNLLVERGGYRIEADSPGTSLLVLPVEYSHCLRADLTSTGAKSPRLLRANLTMAAILFTGRVSGSLMLRYGVLSSGCRFDDWREADALRIGDAREWPTIR